MVHACVRRFDMTATVGNFLGTKQGLVCVAEPNLLLQALTLIVLDSPT